MAGGAEGEDALLGAAFFLVAARAAEGGVEPYLSSACLRLSVFITWVCSEEPLSNGIDAALHPVLVDMDDQVQPQPLGGLVAELDHLPEFPGGVHMQQRKGRLGRIEGLHRQVQHHR